MASPPAPRKLDLVGDEETLFIPLYAKALDYRSRRPILGDAKADEIVRAVDFDYERIRTRGTPTLLVVRARQLDEWVREFVRAHPSSVVVHLGCGLDARYLRIRPPDGVDWYDVDFPRVIEARRSFYDERGSYHMLASAITDPGWIETLPSDRATVVVADGVFEYLDRTDVATLFGRIVDHCPSGEFDFDVLNSFALAMGNARLTARSGARLKWAVDDPGDIDRLSARVKRVYLGSVFRSRYVPWPSRLALGIAFLLRNYRTSIRLVRCTF